MKVISFCSEKGGVGKTTTTVNTGMQLALAGNKVLVVDLDGQGNAGRTLGFIKDGKPTSAELIFNVIAGNDVDIEGIIRHSEVDGLDYIPSNQMLTGISSQMTGDYDPNNILRRIFRHEWFAERYDYILFDCRTLLDILVSNALNASDFVIIPVESGVYSFDGLSKMIDKVNGIHATTNPDLELLGIVLNKQNKTNVGQSVAESVREKYSGQVFINTIPYLPAQCESNVMGNFNEKAKFNEAFKTLVSEMVYRIKKKSSEDSVNGEEVKNDISSLVTQVIESHC